VLKKNFNKLDLVNNLSQKTGFSKNYSRKLVNDLIEIIIQNIKVGDFNLKSIGSFKIVSKNSRLGRNPKTKEEFLISARKSISFKPSKRISKELDRIT